MNVHSLLARRDVCASLALPPERVSVTDLQAGSIKATVEILAALDGGQPGPQACGLQLEEQAADPSSPLRQRIISLISARVLVLDASAAACQSQTLGPSTEEQARGREWLINGPLKNAKQQEASDYLHLVRQFMRNPPESGLEMSGQEAPAGSRQVPSTILKGLNESSLDPLLLDSRQKPGDGNNESWPLRAAGRLLLAVTWLR